LGTKGQETPQGFPRAREPSRLFLTSWVEKIQFRQFWRVNKAMRTQGETTKD